MGGGRRWERAMIEFFPEQHDLLLYNSNVSGAFIAIGGSSNGRTLDFDSRYRGSNPCPPARILELNNTSIRSIYSK